MCNVLILASEPKIKGQNDQYPVCLKEVEGASILERLFKKTKGIPDVQYVVSLNASDITKYHLDNSLKTLSHQVKIVPITSNTMGSACTVLYAACELDQDKPLLILTANEVVDVRFDEMVFDFQERGLDAGTLVFESVHPRYSYVRLDDKQNIIEVSQKNPITNLATAGVFWYKKTSDLVKYSKDCIRKKDQKEGLYYIATVFNQMILDDKKIGFNVIEGHQYKPIKLDQRMYQDVKVS